MSPCPWAPCRVLVWEVGGWCREGLATVWGRCLWAQGCNWLTHSRLSLTLGKEGLREMAEGLLYLRR